MLSFMLEQSVCRSLDDDEESVELARLTIQALLVLVERGMLVNTSDVVAALTMAQDGSIDKFVALYEEEIIKDNSGKPIRVKTLGQKVYVDSIKNHDVVFGIGPAGYREDLFQRLPLRLQPLNVVKLNVLF